MRGSDTRGGSAETQDAAAGVAESGAAESGRFGAEWQTIPDLVRSAAERFPGTEAVIDSGGRVRVTYAELARRVERAAAACIASDVRPGDRVAVWAPNSLDWIVAALGAVSAGAVLVPLNTRFKGAEAADVLRRSGTRLLFVTGTFLGTSYVASLRRAAGTGRGEGAGGEGKGAARRADDAGVGGRTAARPLPGLPELQTAVVLSGTGTGPGASAAAGAGEQSEAESEAEAKSGSGSEAQSGSGSETGTGTGTGDVPPGFTTWRDFLAAGEGVEGRAVRDRSAALDGDSWSDIVFTSGTTGRPKGVVVSHAQSVRAYDTWAGLAGLRHGDRYLIVNPFFHTFGYKAGVLACLTRGATMIPQPVFDVETALANIAAEQITVLPGPPTLFQSLLDHPARRDHDLTALRLVVTGAAVVPLRLVERLRSDLAVETVLTAYGLSEASGVVTMCRRGDPPEVVAATSGRAIPGVEVRTVDGAGADVPAGAPGEILVRGFNVMRGYYQDAAATADALDKDGWLRTGDIGVLDDAGNLRITDRLKDMYVVGGFNAYPAEIERRLTLHPDVTDVAVIGVPDARLGEVGMAYVVRRAGSSLTAADLIAWSRREMANFKVPRHVRFVDRLPRNASGKLVKTGLRPG